MTPWGKPALGVKTRARKKYSNSLILRRRKVSGLVLLKKDPL